MRNSPGGSPAGYFRLMADPRAAETAFGHGRSATMFEGLYREFVRLPSARSAFRRLFLGLAQPASQPGLFHCTTGKDRTGWAAASLLLLLGVPEEIVVADYLASNEHLRGIFDPALDQFEAAGGDRQILEPLTYVRRQYLEAALGEVGRSFGSIEAWFADGLGIDARGQHRLRRAFLEPG